MQKFRALAEVLELAPTLYAARSIAHWHLEFSRLPMGDAWREYALGLDSGVHVAGCSDSVFVI